jgi:tRNA(fMet)-specific endonuclease VapC
VAALVDSSVVIHIERNGLTFDALVAAAPESPLGLASMTTSELLVGVHRADTPERRRRRQDFVEAFLLRLPVLPFDFDAARIYAQVWAQPAAAGQMIGANDLVIAATALAHGYAVLTDNVRHFERIAGLEVQRPVW